MTILLQGAGFQVAASVAPPLPTPLLDLEADALVLSDGDPVATWTDGTYSFTATGTTRPTKQTISTYSAVVFDGVDDLLIGPNFADNLASFALFVVIKPQTNTGGGVLISKIDGAGNHAGWVTTTASFPGLDSSDIRIQTAGNVLTQKTSNDYNQTGSVKVVLSFVRLSASDNLHVYVNGSNAGESVVVTDAIADYSNTDLVAIGNYADGTDIALAADLYAIRIYTPVPDATTRAAIEAQLAARYGITL